MQLALARVRRGRNVGHLTDAFALPQFALRRDAQAARNARSCRRVQKSEIRFMPTERFDELDDYPADRPEIRWLAAEQSNSSLVIADTVVLKLVRRVVGGIHPEAEISRYLTELGYANTAPALWRSGARRSARACRIRSSILQGFIDNQGDAWN